ncbi:MAG: glutamine synthetase III [Butyricicoccus porcorum]|uniref:glutamine synthetase III family protein n=1 Tax=Butyricicoccus porcorum TaxID=1945634 RepID=UPI0023557EF1|nr:glutamine synthetase III [Butyricicoccus porcorum]MDD6985990.1 glutamine synthetase III [Butyricicoccus porcorum]MDY4483788.1 glutamine synthetase III [Butyricicoccus porcorum]
MVNIPEIFAENVFNENVMRDKLPKEVFKKLMKTIDLGEPLDVSIANVVANAMKDWAVEKGATHYTHWFQPMTGITAEKHDSFITPTAGGKVIMSFGGKELIQGEPDASSFPSGGLRATFEARGYTAWDPSSYAFVKDGTLYIPTAFCSYTGEALDKKTPLLRSMDAISKQACRVMKLFGKDVKRVTTTVGPEQEYFLVDKKYYDQRKDLIFTGRTLFGAMSPKGQEMEDHYFGTIKPRIAAFMADLDVELWKYGLLAKTKHNEVAPAQHEVAPIFSTTNIATDNNQLLMDIAKKVALKHGMVCLLHEKPFDGVNGSGKHNNWSMSTDMGENLLNPGKDPKDNAQFMLILTAVITAVDKYAKLMRLSVASAGNDHRLGANEAPPAIVSVFLGDELERVVRDIIDGGESAVGGQAKIELGVTTLPVFPKDNTDRNRTSPFAFTGNRFEFRMPGSSQSIGCINMMLNTAVADVFKDFADELEGAEDFQKALNALIKRELTAHQRVIFNGNGYDDSWIEEAEKRGLPNLRSTPEALAAYDEFVDLFEETGVLSEAELKSRQEILLDEYAKTIAIESRTMVDMSKKDILPAVSSYVKELSDIACNKKTLGLNADLEIKQIEKLSALASDAYDKTAALEEVIAGAADVEGAQNAANYEHETVIPAMDALRAVADEMEVNTAEKYWPFPAYDKLLFGI